MSSGAELPRGTVTFLFTDVEGSTRLLKQLRDRYREVLEEHQRILRRAFEDHGGREIDTQGDSFFVAFPRAKDAVAAAVQAQRDLAQETWPEGAEVRVRMGLHTGEPAVGGERYVGLGVHRAARISAAGHGGQVLVSQTTRELLRDDPLPDVSLGDLGEHQLKDLDEPERIYQLVAPGLREDFPPLNTAPAVPFAGREGELVEAAEDVVQELARPWRLSRRVLVGAALVAAVVGAVLGVLLTRGGTTSASASGEVAANAVGVIDAKSGNAIWVANGLDGTVSRIDPQTNQVTQTVTVGNAPSGVAYGENAVWVANSADGTVSRVDPSAGRVTLTVPAAVGVTGVAVGFGRVWTVSPSSGSVVGLAPSSGEVQDRIGVGVDAAAVTAGAGAVWVANRGDGTISKIDPRAGAVTATIQVGRSPDAVAAGPGGVWVASAGDGTLSRIDPSSDAVVRTVRLTNPPQGLALSGRGVYVAVRSSGREHRGGTLRVLVGSPDFIDPALAYTLQSWMILITTNDGLVAFRRVGGAEGTQLVPDLAVSLPTPTDGGKTYTFQLRPDVRYSSGRLVEPQDVRRELERVFEIDKPISAGRQLYGGIVGTDRCRPGKACDLSQGIVTDRFARSVSFHLKAPDADFLTKLTLPFAFPVPAGTPAHDVGTKPVPATGPYTIGAYRSKRFLKLVRNPRFRQWSADAQPQGYPDTIAWRFHDSDVASEVRAIERGQADIALTLAPPLSKQELDRLALHYPGQLRTATSSATWYFFLNTRVPPFDDVRVRRAVNYAFDRQAFAELLGRAFAPTCQILPPNFPGYRRTCLYLPGGLASLQKARELVRKSGTTGARVRVWVPAPLAIQGHPSDLSFLKEEFGCDAFVPGHPEQTTFASEFCDRSLDAQMEHAAAVQATDPPAATALWQRIEREILLQAPVVPTYNVRNVDFVSKRVGNYQFHPQWFALLDQLWVK